LSAFDHLVDKGLPAFAQDVVREDLQGQIVLSLLGNNPDQPVIDAMNAAYKSIRPNVEIIWEYPGTSADGYPTWLGTQVAAENIRPDVVSGNYFPNFEGYLNFDQYRYLTNPHTGRTWDEDLDWNFFVERSGIGERLRVVGHRLDLSSQHRRPKIDLLDGARAAGLGHFLRQRAHRSHQFLAGRQPGFVVFVGLHHRKESHGDRSKSRREWVLAFLQGGLGNAPASTCMTRAKYPANTL
jgi:hypothetical protein